MTTIAEIRPCPPQHIAGIAFDRIGPFHLAVPCLLFDNHSNPTLPRFDLRVCAVEPGTLDAPAGLAIDARLGREGLEEADTVIAPSRRDPAEPAPSARAAASAPAPRTGLAGDHRPAARCGCRRIRLRQCRLPATALRRSLQDLAPAYRGQFRGP